MKRMKQTQLSETLLTREEVRARVGNPSRATLWRWVARGIFPQPLRLGLRKLAWRESEIDAWLADRQ
ncbi:MAG: helix-turn-helix transcriptional regulator [Candidatus Binataceae bacterium]